MILTQFQGAHDTEEKPPNALSGQPLSVHDPKQSLTPVLTRFETIRKAVEQAVSVHDALVQKAQQEEDRVQPQERTALMERRAALIEEVRTKNEKVKLLIDHLRELHRDILILVSSYYKPLSSQAR